MSKEMTVIVLGVFTIVLTQIGIPSSWRAALLILTGIMLIALGFFLRSEALTRGRGGNRHFVENTPAEHYPEHERKEGITSLN